MVLDLHAAYSSFRSKAQYRQHRLGELTRELFRQRRGQCIGNDVDVLSHDLPGFCFVRVILFLELGDLRDMMGPMRSDQSSNRVFWKVGIGSAEEGGDLVGISGRSAGIAHSGSSSLPWRHETTTIQKAGGAETFLTDLFLSSRQSL
jgi:hypothetical protein